MITKKDFKAYLEVQHSGVTNMWDFNMVSKLSGLNKDQYLEIIKNYSKYKKEFNI